MELLLFFALLLLAAIAVCLVLLLRRPAPDVAPVLARVEALERLLERGDRTLRDESQRGRDEASARMESLRAALDRQFAFLREENAAKLEQMRRTVDEQLQGTL